MKLVILGDTHFGARGDSLDFHKFFQKFYDEVFFPYLLENDIKVVVNTGKVSVYRLKEVQAKKVKSEVEGVLVTENQQIIFDKKETNFTKLLVDQPKVINQNNSNQFEFNDASAAIVFSVIQKAYGVNIVFDEELMKYCPITASLSEEPLLGKIELVCQAIEAEYEVLEGQIIISGKGCK